MKKNELTPAQAYANSIVETVDELLAAEPSCEYGIQKKLAKLIMERPRTLRCALSAYLYKSQMQSTQSRRR